MTEPRRLTRRALLRSAGTVGAAGATAALLAACTPAGSGAAASSSAVPYGTATPAATPGASTVPSSSSSRVLIAYFSRPGENYSYGDRVNLRTGNTEVLTRFLTDRIDADVFRIEARDPYSSSYDATVRRNVREQQSDARPAIAGDLPSLDDYDTVLLGSPIWNVRPPMIMSTFAEGVEWSGRALYPYVTYAVSGLGQTAQTYRNVADGARIGEGLAVQGEKVADGGPAAQAWLGRVGLL